MKTEIRDFFIENFNHLVETGDIETTEARSERYQNMLRHYMKVADENICGCFDSPLDILNEIKKSENVIKNYIQTGKVAVAE